MNEKKPEVCTMKKIIFPVIASFVVLGGLTASNFVSGVAAEELTAKLRMGFLISPAASGKTNVRDFATSPGGTT